MNIHSKINYRKLVEEQYNDSTELANFFGVEYHKKQPPKLILLEMVFEGQKLLSEQQMYGMEICRESSNQMGRETKRFVNPVFNQFRMQPRVKKHAEDLQYISKALFYNN